jgi:phosphoadenosine phosphosulfate reductase
VLIDIATRFDDQVEVIFLDTGSHFVETLAFVQDVRTRYSLNLQVITPGADADAWPCGSERCCEFRKVLPLDRALAERTAWMTGLKRVDTPARAHAPVVGWDTIRGMIKVNPLARWSHDDLAHYESDHPLPRPSPARCGLPLHRLQPDHTTRHTGRRRARRPLAWRRKDRVRAAHGIARSER